MNHFLICVLFRLPRAKIVHTFNIYWPYILVNLSFYVIANLYINIYESIKLNISVQNILGQSSELGNRLVPVNHALLLCATTYSQLDVRRRCHQSKTLLHHSTGRFCYVFNRLNFWVGLHLKHNFCDNFAEFMFYTCINTINTKMIILYTYKQFAHSNQ